MLRRLSPKERVSHELAEIYNSHRPSDKTRDELAVMLQLKPIILRNIEEGKAHQVRGQKLLKVFDFLPIESLEVRDEALKLIKSIRKDVAFSN